MQLFFIILVFIIISVVTKNYNKNIKNEWAKAAEKLKLRFIPGNPIGIISGKNQGNHIKVFTVNRGANKNSSTYTNFKITYKTALPFSVSFVKQGMIQGILSVFGAQDIKTGSAEFDRLVVVKGEEEGQIINYLTPERQRIIRLLLNRNCDTTINQRCIEVSYQKKIKKESEIFNKVKQLERYVKVLADEGIIEQTQEEIVKPKFKVQILVPPTVVKEPVVAVIGKPEKSPFILKSTQITESLSTSIEPEVEASCSGEVSSISKPMPKTESLPTSIEAERSSPNEITADYCCHALYESRLGTQAIKERFDNSYKNHTIEWEATLCSVEPFSSDFVFKNCSGVKADFKLMEVDRGFRASEIMATVHFQQEELELLESRLNEKVAFSGRLLQLNPLVKTIFISEGKVKTNEA